MLKTSQFPKLILSLLLLGLIGVFCLIYLNSIFFEGKTSSHHENQSVLKPFSDAEIESASPELKKALKQLNQSQVEVQATYQKAQEYAQERGVDEVSDRQQLGEETQKKINDLKIRLEHLKRIEEQL